MAFTLQHCLRLSLITLFLFSTCTISANPPAISSIILHSSKTILNPVLQSNDHAVLTVTAIRSNGSTVTIPRDQLRFTAASKLISGNDAVVNIKGDTAFASAGGVATITVVYMRDGQTLTATTDIVVRPYYREYHQALVLKLFLGMEGEPVERLKNELLFQKPHDVLCTFEQALEVIRRTDNLTQGIPKIIYLVGWQAGGHDHWYPAWFPVNENIKRPQDATALESLRWLIREGRKYTTTVRLHINMVDSYRHSPLSEEYML